MAAFIRSIADRLLRPRYVKLIVHVDVLPQLGWIGDLVATEFKDYRGITTPRMVIGLGSEQDTVNAQPIPGTLSDDLGCLAALITLCALAYGLLVLA